MGIMAISTVISVAIIAFFLMLVAIFIHGRFKK